MSVLAPNGELWVTDAENGKITYFIKNDTMELGDITVGKRAHAIAFNTYRTKDIVTNQLDGRASIIDVTLHKVIKFIPVEKKPTE